VRRLFLLLALIAAPAFPADQWIEYRFGPFHVFSDAGDKPARDRLTEMEQLRHVLGTMLGKGGLNKSELETIWPIDVVLFSNAREYVPHSLPKPFVDG